MASIFDIFGTGPQQDAATAQISGLNKGYDTASGDINSAIGALNTNYTSALQPYMTNFSQANAGTTQLGNVLGLNGQPGSDAAMKTLQSTPGYQFQLEQGNNAINAQAAATGMNASGNQALALSKFNQGLAGTTYNNYVSQLQPYLSAAGNAAGGIAGVNTGLGNATANQYDQKAQLGYSTATGIGNANANAELSRTNASGNIMNAAGSIGSTIASLAPFLLSDERLKEDISPVGELFDGQTVYSYRYKGDDTPQIGLMAQEVEQVRPDAVVEFGGYKAVDYRKATEFASHLSRFLEAA